MASSKYVEEIQRGVESLINCLICTDKYTNPKILPCQHTFCLPCLEKFYESYTSQRIIRTSNFPCPQCRKNVYIPAGGLETLPSDFKVGQIQEVFERINFSMVNKEIVICDVCRYEYKNSTAEGFCAQCAKYLCGKCSEQHAGNVLFQGHSLIAMGTTNAESLICPDHQEEIKYYCSNCRIALCTVCALGKHSKHETLSLSDTLEQQRVALQKHLDTLRHNLLQHEGKAESLGSMHSQQTTNIDEVKETISRHAQACISRVKEDEARLIKELDKAVGKGTADLDAEIEVINAAVVSIKEALAAAEDLLTKSNSLDSISQYEQLEKYLKTNSTLPNKTFPESLHSVFKLLPKTDLNIGHIKVSTIKPRAVAEASAGAAPPKSKSGKSDKLNLSGQSKVSFAKEKTSTSSRSDKQSPSPANTEAVKSHNSSIADDAASTSSFDKPLRSSTPVSVSKDAEGPTVQPEPVSRVEKPQPSVEGASALPQASSRGEKQPQATAEGAEDKKPSPERKTFKSSKEIARSSPSQDLRQSDDESSKAATSCKFQVKKTDSTDLDASNSSDKVKGLDNAKALAAQTETGNMKTSQNGNVNKNVVKPSSSSQAQGGVRDTRLLWKTMDRPEARDIDFLPDGSLVVTEYKENSDKLQVFDQNGNLKCSVTCSAQNIRRPWGLAVNQTSGYMVITDHGDRAVKVLDSELSMRTVWRSIFNRPSGVCVMRNGDFAVTDTGKHMGMISIHTQSGICKRDFCNKGSESGECRMPNYIAADHSDRLIVADPELHCIKIFDPRGKQLLKFCAADHPPMNPQGVAVDSHNNILVADQGLNTVSLYSPEGRFVQHLSQLKDSPWGIGVHASGLLAVATDPSLQVFSVPVLKA